MFRSLLRGGLLLRTISKELGGIRLQLTRQADLLERLAAHFAPSVAQPSASRSAADLSDTGASYLDELEAGLVQDYVERTKRDTGRDPDEDEILTYLADEKTIDLHARLKDREARAQLDRLERTR